MLNVVLFVDDCIKLLTFVIRTIQVVEYTLLICFIREGERMRERKGLREI